MSAALPASRGTVAGRWWRELPIASRAGLVIVLLLVLTAAFAPWIAPYDPGARVAAPFGRPSAAHWLGTDDGGHDLLSMLIVGARASLLVGFVAAAAATLVGVVVGTVAGYARGVLDTVLMRVVDVVMSLPVVPLTLVIGVLVGPGLLTQVLVISAAMWAPLARELRAQVLSIRERDFVQALRAMGARNSHVLLRHVFPAVGALVVPQLVLAIKEAIMLEASLAFLGLGDIHSMSWGMILSVANDRSAFLTDAWAWWVVPPGAMIAITVLGFALAGGAVERAGDGSLQRRRQPLLLPRLPAARRAAAAPVPVASTLDAPLLVVDGLTVRYRSGDALVGGCTDVSLVLRRGESIGLVGESGSGKSTVAAALTGLMAPAAVVLAGRVLLDGIDLLALPDAERRALLGARIGLVPQEAQSALNPVLRVGAQLVETLQRHQRLGRAAATARAAELLAQVGLPPERLRAYPHELSGGQRQRAVIAIAVANAPDLLVADEPTSGLDVLVQEEILELLAGLRRRTGMSIVVVTHDLPVVARLADLVAVMQDGEVVEQGPVDAVLRAPRHERTAALIASLPALDPVPDAEAAR